MTTVLPSGRKTGPLVRAIDGQGTSECVRWTGSYLPNGYGIAGNGKGRPGSTTAHRRVYMLVVGPIAKGLQLDHLCRNRWCVNVAHLEPVTAAENVRRGHLAMGLDEHCRRGHPWSAENTRVYSGRRWCVTCHANRREARAAERAA